MFTRTAIRQFSSLTRRPFSLPPRNGVHNIENGSPLTFYRVRFQRPPIFSRRRIRNGLFYALPLLVAFYALEAVEIDVEIEGNAKSGKGGAKNEIGKKGKMWEPEDEDEEDDEDDLFIPFGWPKLQPRTFYKGNDPEWKAFVKFSKDTQKKEDVFRKLVSNIRSDIETNPEFKRMLGVIDSTKGRHWLEYSFPPGPPQEYEVRGLQVGDDFIAWSAKTVSQVEYQQLRRTMLPIAANSAFFSSMRYKLDTQLNKLRSLVGLEPTYDEDVLKIKRQYEHIATVKASKEQAKNQPGSISSAPTQSAATPNPSEKVDTSTTSTTKPTNHPAPIAPDEQQQQQQPKPLIPQVPTPGADDKPISFVLFMHNFRKSSKPFTLEAPRGTLIVSGLVEIVGTRGRTTLDVVAAYNPTSNQFEVSTSKLRRYQPKSQAPRGGH